jgi:hypothetical protein
VSGRTIDELADTIRQRLDADEASVLSGDCRCGTGRKRPDCPDRILADVARDRDLLARLLAEKHRLWESCAAKDHSDNPLYSEMPCACGRDERVRGYLELLAGVDETEAAG